MAVISGTKRLRTSWTHSRFWNSKRNKPIDCQLLERLDPLFEALAKEIELEGLHFGEDGYVCLVTESKLHMHFQQEDESLLSICELGRLTTDEGRMEMLETLLAANALWEGTKGATLSLEPTSGKVLLARKRTINELVSPAP